MRLKYLKISNSCVGFESNRIVTNYSIRFEISNIRTALVRTAYLYVLITVDNCGTQYSTEQFC